MIPFRVTLDLDSALEASDRLRHALNDQMEEAMRLISEDVADEARRGHTFQNRTGDLEASIQAIEPGGTFMLGTLAGFVHAFEDYAEYVEEKPGFEFLEPAWERVEPHVDQILQLAIEQAAGLAGW